jgi:hypothetical protein
MTDKKPVSIDETLTPGDFVFGLFTDGAKLTVGKIMDSIGLYVVGTQDRAQATVEAINAFHELISGGQVRPVDDTVHPDKMVYALAKYDSDDTSPIPPEKPIGDEF